MAKKQKVLCIQDKYGNLSFFAGNISDPKQIVLGMEVGDATVTSITNNGSGTFYVNVAGSHAHYRVMLAEQRS